jgi:L-threonylcarbamoyladenylate synthase
MGSLKKTLVLKIDPDSPDQKKISRCAKLIRDGGLVAFPTETVYGIAANLLDRRAMARLCKVKKRPRGKPFTVHIAGPAAIRKMNCRISKEAKALTDKFWPGPLTVVLLSDSGRKIGFRMPDNRVALDLIRKARVPVVAPSANLSDETPPKDAASVLEQLDGKIDIVLDAGMTDVGIESTVVDMTVKPPLILREGAIKKKEILKRLGYA